MVSGAAPPQAQHEAAVLELKAGESHTQWLANGANQNYQLNLSTNTYVNALLVKNDLHLSIEITGPNARPVRTFISNNPEPLQFSFITTDAGQYNLTITSLEHDSEGQNCTLTIRELRPATDHDRKCDGAAGAFAAAERLRAEWREESLREAIKQYLIAFEIWKANDRRSEAAWAMICVGDIFFTFSDNHQALYHYNQALSLSRNSSDPAGIISALNRIGYVYANQGKQPDALRSLRHVLRYERQMPVSSHNDERLRRRAQVTNNLGEVYYYLGDLKKAAAYFEEALVLENSALNRRGQALAHLNLGYVYTDKGNLTSAAAQFQKALALWEAVADERGKAQTLTAMGMMHSFTGNKQSALNYHDQSLAVFRQIGDRQGEAASLNSIGKAYEDLNEPQVALDHYARALKLFQESDNQDAQAVTNYYVGRVQLLLNNDEKALVYYRQSKSLSQRLGKRRIEGYALTDIATIYARRGQRQRALENYRQVLQFYRQIDDRRGQAHVLNSIGHLYQMSGNQKAALIFYRKALIFSRAAEDRQNEALTLYNIARVEQEAGHLEEAVFDIKAALRISEALRTKVGGDYLRASYFTSVHDQYGHYIDLLMQLHKLHPNENFATTAFEVSDHARARSLLDLLAGARLDIRRGVDPQLLQRESVLQQQLYAEANRELHPNSLNESKKEDSKTEETIRQLTTEYREVQSRISEQGLNNASLSTPAPLSLADIQAQLHDTNTLLLEYELGKEKSYLWAITVDSISSFELPKRAEIEDAALKVQRLLASRPGTPPEQSLGRQADQADSDRLYWQEAARLSRILLGDVSGQLRNQRLLIVADGALQYVPFEALPLQNLQDEEIRQTDSAKALNLDQVTPLMMNHEIVNLPSASILATLRQKQVGTKPEPGKVVVVMADPVFESDDPRVLASNPPTNSAADKNAQVAELHDPLSELRGPNWRASLSRLPFTSQEAEAIMAVTPPQMGAMLVGFAASRDSAVAGELSKYQIVHFATHGVINDRHPELSGIVLSMVNQEGAQENGFLQLHDIYNLNLSADVVVLSACDTGLGKDVRGEGLVGLTRGFLSAGSKGVVASLWRVDDQATAELMGHYYQAMFQDGLSPAAALQSAQRQMWKGGRFRSPYYWAAFIFQGDYRVKIKISSQGPGWSGQTLFWLVILSLFLMLIFAIKLKHRSRKALLR